MNNNTNKIFITTSKGILKIPFLEGFLNHAITRKPTLKIIFAFGKKNENVIGWGCRPSTKKLKKYAKKFNLPFISVEDGFLRSYGTGNSFPPLSLVVDKVGIYYDSTQPNELENRLNSDKDWLTPIADEVKRAKQLIITHQLSKYNHAPCLDNALLRANDQQRVLVVDQTEGDMSVLSGGADRSSFTKMLQAARAENPQATIYIKTHPEVSSGHKKGYLTVHQEDEKTVLIRQLVNPLSLIKEMDKVYVVTSTMGFEALLLGKPVSCFGSPWYAGWGVTDDRQRTIQRTKAHTVDELFATAYFDYSRYLNPTTHQCGTIFDVIDWLIQQKTVTTQLLGKTRTKGRVIGIGFRHWKAFNLKPLLGLDLNTIQFVKDERAAQSLNLNANDSLLVWGARAPIQVTKLAQEKHTRLLHIEDGFIRSVGLGSDLTPPRSIVVDTRGLYFDSTRPSDLEHILNTKTFSAEDLIRAQKIRTMIVEHGVTKYNLEPRKVPKWATENRRIILVPGQVEDDASILLGSYHIKTNLALLETVRKALPDAYIVYKPHPDVTSGNRHGKLAATKAQRLADHIETDCSIVSCIEACDEVHTMTSLSGFDALLRQKKVVTYGQPFYAGWGLTTDQDHNGSAFTRRTRQLNLDELVAGTLIYYPLYWDDTLKGYTSCEATIIQIIKQRDQLEKNGQLTSLRNGYWQRQSRKIAVLIKAWGTKTS